MKNTVELLKKTNPTFTHELYDSKRRRSFIAQYFNTDILNTYDKLVPGAYKADLWRLCVIYQKGGFYLDIKYRCTPDFTLAEVVDQGVVFVKERDSYRGIHNAFFGSYAKNPVLLNLINQIARNVQAMCKNDSLNITGPHVFSDFFDDSARKTCQYIYNWKSDREFSIDFTSNNKPALVPYESYRNESRSLDLLYYNEMFNHGFIYNLEVQKIGIYCGDYIDSLVFYTGLSEFHYPPIHGGGNGPELTLQENEYITTLTHGIDHLCAYRGTYLALTTNLNRTLECESKAKITVQCMTYKVPDDHAIIGLLFKSNYVDCILLSNKISHECTLVPVYQSSYVTNTPNTTQR